MTEIEISFASKDLAESSQLARELRDKLRSEGVPDKAMSIERGQSAAMNAGEILHLAYELAEHIVQPATFAVHVAVLAKSIYGLCRKGHSGVSIKIGPTILHLSAGEIDASKIEEIRKAVLGAVNVSGNA